MPTNDSRKHAAQVALDAYVETKLGGTEDREALVDLVTDCLHLAGSEDAVDYLLRVARGHWEAETTGREP